MKKMGFGMIELLMVAGILALFVGGGMYIKNFQSEKSIVQTGLDAEARARQAMQQLNQQSEQEQEMLNELGSASSGLVFSVPAPYSRVLWKTVSSSCNALYLSPALSTFKGVLRGELYEASNTDPNARAWERMDAAAPPDQPEGFYGGDRLLLTYYDEMLRAAGYQTESLSLDRDLHAASQKKSAYVLGPMSADGPRGTVRGYIKYADGKIRTIIISSNNATNQVFISDVVDLRSLFL